MRHAKRSDKNLVVDIMAQTLNENRGVVWMLKSQALKHLRTLSQYAFYKAYYKNGAYISDNEKGVALCFKFSKPVKSIIPAFMEFIFAIKSVKIRFIPKIIKLEAYKKRQRPVNGEYLYFWFFCVEKGGEDAGFELKNEIFAKATAQKLPIYAETSKQRNKVIYERFGFKTYHYYEDQNNDFHYWFMKWEPSKA